MYSYKRFLSGVRDEHAYYGGGHRPREAFAAAGVLDDLAVAPAGEMELILARYAALRAWVLRAMGAEAALTDHAVDAAWRHLAVAPAEWTERPALAALLDCAAPGTAPGLLETAAESAAALGHRHGEAALREVAHRIRWFFARYTPPSES